MARQSVNCDSTTNLAAMFFEQAERIADAPFLWAKHDGHYRPLSGLEARAMAVTLAHGLTALGITRGDRVMLVAENRPEWLIADVAIMAIGAITVPAYTTNTAEDHLHILNDATPRAVIVSTPTLAERVVQAAAAATIPPQIITITPQNPGNVMSWQEVMSHGDAAAPALPLAVNTIGRNDTACIIYTSGTGGRPKGVMLSHGNILHNCMGAQDVLAEIGLDDETFLSFLPLSHSYEHTAGQFFPVSIGAQIYYAEGIDRLSANLLEARPTIVTAVPRLYETMRARILQGVARTGGWKKSLFDRALSLGRKRYEHPASMTLIDRLIDLALDRLVRAKVTARFGGRLKAMVSGGAPLDYEVGLFFTALGLTILQGYGQTESAPVVSCNRRGQVRLDAVGQPLKGVAVRIADDGEILVRGPLVMQGYWGQPEATHETIDSDGWLHTGDIGVIDDDGHIRITDRKKDIIVNSGGDNIAPQKIEGRLTLEPEIAQAMVYGDRRPYLVALIVPDSGSDITAAIERVNRTLSGIERIRRFIVIDEPFSIANEMLTPTMKIRRHRIRERYGVELDRLYEK